EDCISCALLHLAEGLAYAELYPGSPNSAAPHSTTGEVDNLLLTAEHAIGVLGDVVINRLLGKRAS
ncbi:unnamed protein product, partial [Amoebophrya sp. A25]